MAFSKPIYCSENEVHFYIIGRQVIEHLEKAGGKKNKVVNTINHRNTLSL